MSATVDTNTASWRKRYREDDPPVELRPEKRPRLCYFRLESESSRASEEDTESVYSLQGKETDVVRDTSDTESKSDCSDDEYEVEIEYEVASLSDGEHSENCFSNSSSGSEGMMLAAVAGAICDSSLEAWITDCEDSDNSSMDETSFGRTDFSTCVQCKSENDNPLYRYCEKCFQDRKKFFPPRPRAYRRSRKPQNSRNPNPVKLDSLRSCLKGLSQDSGIGSSQECPSLDLDQIVVPQHLQPGTSKLSTTSIDEKSSALEDSSDLNKFSSKSRKRNYSESSLSDFEVVKKPKKRAVQDFTGLKADLRDVHAKTSDLGSEISSLGSFSSGTSEKPSTETEENVKRSEMSELCIFCNNAPKDSIFLHTNMAHRCCCYKCAKRTLHTIKRCPICNRSVNKVLRIYTS